MPELLRVAGPRRWAWQVRGCEPRSGYVGFVAPLSPRNADRVSAAPRLAAVAISCPTAFAATATRCAPSLKVAPTALVSRFTAAPKDLACVEIADSCGSSSAA